MPFIVQVKATDVKGHWIDYSVEFFNKSEAIIAYKLAKSRPDNKTLNFRVVENHNDGNVPIPINMNENVSVSEFIKRKFVCEGQYRLSWEKDGQRDTTHKIANTAGELQEIVDRWTKLGYTIHNLSYAPPIEE